MVTRTRLRFAGALLAIALLLAACMSAEERTFLDRTNAYRVANGVPTVQEHGTLTNKAEAWAQHMARTGRLAHSDLTANLGGLQWYVLGENVGYSSRTSNTLLSLHNQFVNSPPHRANLVDRRFTHMGVGVAVDSAGRTWVAEVFAKL